MIKKMKGYKVFNPDWKCNGMQYRIGQTYKHTGDLSLCESGFHFCERLIDCFNYYRFDPKNKVALISASGEILPGGDKSVTNNITIIEEISWQDVLALVNIGKGNTGLRNSGGWNSGDRNSGGWNSGNGNSGYRNSGNWNSGGWNSGGGNSGDNNSGGWNSGNGNSGDRNSGDRNSGGWNSGGGNSGDRNSGGWNSGDRNSGYRNSGDRNSGNWNKTNYSSGFFNSKDGTVRMFNKDSGFSRDEFYQKFTIPACLHFDLTKWVSSENMTDKEKKNNPKYETAGGYLKSIPYKEASVKSLSKATDKEKGQIRALPNYDPDVFEEIFGIRI